jgi:hypothetical protein
MKDFDEKVIFGILMPIATIRKANFILKDH